MKWSLLDKLPEDDARAVLAASRRRRFARHEVVFHEGDPGDTLHLVDKGRVAVRVTSPLGDTVTLRILGPGAIFGELALLSPAPRNATIVAVERTETLAVHRDRFEQLRREHPEVDRFLLEALITEVRRLSNQLLEALHVPVPKRVALRLVDLADQYADGPPPVLVPLTQDDIADLCGATRPTVNKVLRELEDQGVVDIARGQISILDPARLQRIRR
jgi:CRP-like cAMP-binding protein